MDFELVLKTLLAEFGREQIRYAVIGGFALGVLGAPRQTMDLDFLVHREDLTKLDACLARLGYKRVFHTENVSQYQHGEERWGSLDFVHAFRRVSLAMLQRAKERSIFGETQSVKVAEAEDVIGLKVQAMCNDAARSTQERADIERLMARFGKGLDWERVGEYYELFGLGAEAKNLRERFGRAD
ncbi:MAG TPA: nucleotidyltransferase family protein [Terriglobales bacterium]|nr:nucleotidyltransferase family protein [Terriglobales bacterium]